MRKTLILFLVFIANQSFCQTIKGIVSDKNRDLLFSTIIIKKIQSPGIVYQFSTTNEKGEYSIDLKTPLDSIIIEVNSYSHEPFQKFFFDLQKKGKIITLDFKLEPRTTFLKEVVVQENRKPIRIKNDTIVYDPEKFKDGSEKVVEDLLKKLPGIKIEENGEIKFNGKSIKKMLLDGDDLFDSQYTVGSKNINVEMLDKVEAIENYNENLLLKGIAHSEDVALNLKLKKGKNDFSGNAQLGIGFSNKYNFITSGILINDKIKSFGVTSYNNIGKNNAPYDFQSGVLSFESLKESNFIAKELINHGNFYSQLDDKFHKINNNFYTSLNSLYKFSKKVTAKFNVGFYSDKLSRENKEETIYTTDTEKFSILQSENSVKSPKLYHANLQLINKVNDHLHWEYLGKLQVQQDLFSSTTTNNTTSQKNDVNTKNWFTKNNFNLTKRINEKSAFTTSTLFTKSYAPQHYNLNPGVNIEENYSGSIINNQQNSRFDKEVLDTKAEYLSKTNDSKWLFRTGFHSTKNHLYSLLETTNENNETYTNPTFQNNLNYDFSSPFLDGSFAYDKNKFVFKAGFGSQYYSIKLTDKTRNNFQTDKNLILSPLLKIGYRFNKNATIDTGYSYNQITPDETNLFQGTIQTGFRSFRNNEANLEFLNTHNYNLNFNYHDAFYNTHLSIGLNHNQRSNNYFQKSLINNNVNITTSFLLNSGNRDYAITISGEKYIHFLRTTFQLNSHYSISLDKNIINNSELRDVESKNVIIELSVRTGVIKNLFVENKFFYMSNSFSIRDGAKNNFSSLKNALKTIYKINEKFKTEVILNIITPDLSLTKNYYFLDSEVTFTSKNKKFDYSIIARNLTNNKTFETNSITDYSRTSASHNLINRFILASVSFRL
ncbi:porin family protein [Flavobacterium xinjiangense]|uniref:Outer membrane receptor proteins, mostly Fe transport n=1 Tax=Flavobacterium xinjiangense TaxID=178356 RepID=A0A1M7M8E0_9FLAO|nr:hypothetical protein [Flavobacterium xinjiangense]SHM87050.1 hypothetical protein SAMN05216269_10823 [Flavobacterium xinjiangense]